MAYSATRFSELMAMLQFRRQYKRHQHLLCDPTETDLVFCYRILEDVSRSFTAVIMQLPTELRHAVCLQYLVLRGLDTVEDDMALPLDTKLPLLSEFHQVMLQPDWHVDNIGKGQERVLLQQFFRVGSEVLKLKPEYQTVITETCQSMAHGMKRFLSEHGVQTCEAYDLYCHYVAGIVGHGLTRLFAVSELERREVMTCPRTMDLANSMGLFLQKTNIIRDYYEDIRENPPRIFWPTEIYGQFATTLDELKETHQSRNAVQCLNAMLVDALRHVPDCLQYLALLQHPSVFAFCAVPQVMAICTLTKLLNNPLVFQEKVRIRRGTTAQIFLRCTTLQAVRDTFAHCIEQMLAQWSEDDPSYDTSRAVLQRGLDATCHMSYEVAIAQLEHDRDTTFGFSDESGKETPSQVDLQSCLRRACNMSPDALHKEKAQQPSTARRFLLNYPALGSGLLYRVVDHVVALFR